MEPAKLLGWYSENGRNHRSILRFYVSLWGEYIPPRSPIHTSDEPVSTAFHVMALACVLKSLETTTGYTHADTTFFPHPLSFAHCGSTTNMNTLGSPLFPTHARRHRCVSSNRAGSAGRRERWATWSPLSAADWPSFPRFGDGGRPLNLSSFKKVRGVFPKGGGKNLDTVTYQCSLPS